jgi:hypothetical protein
MSETNDETHDQKEKHPIADRISGLGQKIIGEIETIGGILTADPNTAAEGEFNLEVGDLRDEVEEDLEESEENHRRDAGTPSEDK